MNDDKILDTPESFEIKVPIKKYWLLIWVFGMSSIVLGLIFITVLITTIKGVIFSNEMYFQVLLFPLVLNIAAWFFFGFERLIFTNHRLEIIKSNRIFSMKKTINVCDIRSIKIRKEVEKKNLFIQQMNDEALRIREMRKAIFFWRKMGKLILETDNSKRTILNGLKENEINKIKTLIENEIEKRCSK